MSTGVFDLPPNWRVPFSEEIQFRTEIIKSRDGTEQRIAQRINPRYRYSWGVSLTGTGMLALERRLSRVLRREITFVHPRATILTARGQPGAAGIPGRFRSAVSVTGLTDRTVEAAIDIEATPGQYLAADPDLPDHGAALDVYNGLEVLTVDPNWSVPVETMFDQEVEVLDLSRGVVDYVFPEPFTSRIITMEFLVHTLARENALVGLFFRCHGRLRDFYLPDPMTTLDPILPIAASSTFTIPGTDAFEAFVDQEIYRNIEIESRSLGRVRRGVVSVTSLNGNTVVTVDSALPSISASDFLSARWLLRCRFETDLFALDWATDTVATSTFTVRAVEELP